MYLQDVLRQLLRRNLGYHAWEVASTCHSLPHFPHALELLLHQVGCFAFFNIFTLLQMTSLNNLEILFCYWLMLPTFTSSVSFFKALYKQFFLCVIFRFLVRSWKRKLPVKSPCLTLYFRGCWILSGSSQCITCRLWCSVPARRSCRYGVSFSLWQAVPVLSSTRPWAPGSWTLLLATSSFFRWVVLPQPLSVKNCYESQLSTTIRNQFIAI